MDKKFVLFGVLASILIGGSFGIFTIDSSFAQDVSDTREDSEANTKQLDKIFLIPEKILKRIKNN
jgi:hypothetical protein